MASMHVQDLAGGWNGNAGNWKADVTIWVVTSGGANVVGATVSGAWSEFGPGVDLSCVTGGNGRCKLSSGSISAASTIFQVTSVSHSSFHYDSTSNLETQILIVFGVP